MSTSPSQPSSAGILSLVREKWTEAFDAQEILSPLYPSDVVNDIILNVFTTCIRMENYWSAAEKRKLTPSSSGGNILFTGTRGVGKTTLMTGLTTLIRRHFRHVLALYVNFEERENIEYPSTLLDMPVKLTTENYERWCMENKKCAVIFVDEFDSLYTKMDDRKKDIGVAQELLSLGKSSLGFCIISGSSSCLRSWAYKEDIQDQIHNGFPNMNCTVFIEYRLSPVRDLTELKTVLEICGKGDFVHHVKDVFNRTGGVGRFIQEFELATVSESEYRDLPSKIEDYVTDNRYGPVIRMLYVANLDDTNQDLSASLKGVSRVEICHSIPNATKIVMELIDKQVLHLNNNNTSVGLLYEFLFPVQLQQLRSMFTILSRLEHLALEATLKGWNGFGSAGQVLEPLIIRTLAKKKKRPYENIHVSTSSSREITILDWHTGNDTYEIGPLHSILDQVFVPIPDKGLDSFVLSQGVDCIHVDIAQINCGKMKKKIEPGTKRSSDNSKYFTAILKHAETGWVALIASLKTAFPYITFKLNSFALITNKQVAETVIELESVVIQELTSTLIIYEKEDFDSDFEIELREFGILE